MTSSRQIEANRRNAKHSTGPITTEGKEHSRRNALRHGLTRRDRDPALSRGARPRPSSIRSRMPGAMPPLETIQLN